MPFSLSGTNTASFTEEGEYTQAELNPDCLTLIEALKTNNHIDKECWINTLTDDYAREGILDSVYNRTVEEFKQCGASINVIEKVFKKFHIKARLYDIDSNLIYKHDPVDFNSRRVVTFNGLVLNYHFYT